MAKKKGSISKGRLLNAEQLREILKPIYDKLEKAGVPDERLPTNEALISHIVQWVDHKKVDAWVTKFAALEGE